MDNGTINVSSYTIMMEFIFSYEMELIWTPGYELIDKSVVVANTFPVDSPIQAPICHQSEKLTKNWTKTVA